MRDIEKTFRRMFGLAIGVWLAGVLISAATLYLVARLIIGAFQ